MTIKRIILISALVLAGAYGYKYLSPDSGKKTSEKPRIERVIERGDTRTSGGVDNSLEDVLKYIEKNPEQTMSYVINISGAGLRSSYKQEIWDRLSKEDKWCFIKEVAEYKTHDFLEELKELSGDAYDRFKETKIYDKLTSERRQNGRD